MRRKMNKKKVLALVISMLCIALMIHDSCMIFKGCGFTWLGFMTFGFAYFVCAYSVNYLKENKKD